jgi:hypothetical protein
MTAEPSKAGTGRLTRQDDNPRACDEGSYPWSIRRVPGTLKLDGKVVDHPGRNCGREYLRDKEYRPWPPAIQKLLGAFGYFSWAAILFGLA